MKIKVSKQKLKTHYRGSPEVELSNMRTAYVMHIPNTLSLTSARNNGKQKFQLANFILIMLHHMLFFTAAILLWAVRDAQCKTRESA